MASTAWPILNCDVLLDTDVVYQNDALRDSMEASNQSRTSETSMGSVRKSEVVSLSLSSRLENVMFLSPKDVGMPYLKIVEQPVEKFRFRYKSEMIGTHGSISGISTQKMRTKMYPTVKLHNCKEEAIVRCSLYTADVIHANRIPHTHRLIVRLDNEDKDDPHDILVSPEHGYVAVFQGMGIIHTGKKRIAQELIKKKQVKMLEQVKVRNINNNTNHPLVLSRKEESEIKAEAEAEAKRINLNTVSLCFEAFRRDEQGFLRRLCSSVFSNTINNMKSALTGELKICRMDKHVSSCLGGDEIFLFVEKVGKKNIKIKIFELNKDDVEVWHAHGRFSELDVHHQYAIAFRTPAFRDVHIQETVDVFIQLVRPTDGDCSEPLKFTYKPADHYAVGCKRRCDALYSDSPIERHIPSSMLQLNAGPNMYPQTNAQVNLEAATLLSGGLNSANLSLGSANSDMFGKLLEEEDGMKSTEFEDFVKNLSLSDYIQTYNSKVENMDMTMDHTGSIGGTATVLGKNDSKKECKCRGKGKGKKSNSKSTGTGTKVLGGIARGAPTNFAVAAKGDIKAPKMDKASLHDIGNEVPLNKAKKNVQAPANNAVETVKIGLQRAAVHKEMDAVGSNTSVNTLPREETAKSTSFFLNFLPEFRALLLTKPSSAMISKKLAEMFTVQNATHDSILHLFVSFNKWEEMKYILNIIKKVQIDDLLNLQNNKGMTALHIAAEVDQPQMIRVLLEAGADPNLKAKDGNTPLHTSVMHHTNVCTNLLISLVLPKCKINLDSQNDAGFTALHLAVQRRNMVAVEKLIEAGADINVQDGTSGRTALHLAVTSSSIIVMSFLIQQVGIDVNLPNYSGNTPLHTACLLKNDSTSEMCRILLAHNADPRGTDLSEVVIKDEPLSEDESMDPVFPIKEEHLSDEYTEGQYDLASNNQDVFMNPDGVKKEEYSSDMDVGFNDVPDIKEETSQILKKEALCKVAILLDKSGNWKPLAQLMEYSFLIPIIKKELSPCKMLFNYAELRGNVAMIDYMHLLEALNEHEAAEIFRDLVI